VTFLVLQKETPWGSIVLSRESKAIHEFSGLGIASCIRNATYATDDTYLPDRNVFLISTEILGLSGLSAAGRSQPERF
jgi:hypothetical protein